MLLGGIWHGAGWNFLIWGFLHGSYLSIQQVWSKTVPEMVFIPRKLKVLLAWTTTFLAVVFAWVLFRATSLDGAINMMSAMLGTNGLALPNAIYVRLDVLTPIFELLHVSSFLGGGSSFIFTWIWIVFSLAIVLIAPNLQDMFNHVTFSTASYSFRTQNAIGFADKIKRIKWSKNTKWAAGIALFLSLGVLTLSQVSEFLYFQF